MPQREVVHEILDTIPDDILAEVEAYLRAVSATHSGVHPDEAPYDDEPLTAHELEMIERSDADTAAGIRTYSMGEVRAMVDRLQAANGRG